MASETLAWPVPRTGMLPRWFAELVLVGLLLLVFVGLMPFKPVAAPFVTVGEVSGGDTLSQVIFAILFAAQIVISLQRRSLSAVTAMPVAFTLLLAWCVLSALWSAVPDVTIRRAGLQLVLVATIMLAVDTVGPTRSFVILRHLLVAVLLVNWVSIFTIKTARHLPGEDDPSLIGDWRGLYIHKNIAGAVCVLTAILLSDHWLKTRRWRDFALLVLTIGFLIGTRSKTSLGLLPVVLAAGAAYRWGWKSDLNRVIVAAAVALAVVAAGVLLIIKFGALAHTLSNPAGFTGRSVIWQAEIGFIRDHPLLGAGYGTFADTGAQSPLAKYVSNGWIEDVSHGHNGYLQLLVTVGGIGFALAMLEFLFVPLARFWPRRVDNGFRAVLLSIFVFVLLHDMLETDFLDRDGPLWAAFVMMIAALGQSERADEAVR